MLFCSLLLCLPSPSNAQDYPPHVELLLSWDGFRETGKNRGWLADKANRFVGNPKGSPYCAATVSLALDSAEVEYPTVRSGLAANFRTRESVNAKNVISGKDSIGTGWIVVWQKGRSIYGHAGVVVDVVDKRHIREVSFNTSCGVDGSIRDGDGGCVKLRAINPLDYFGIRWFTPVRYPPPEDLSFFSWWRIFCESWPSPDSAYGKFDVRGLI